MRNATSWTFRAMGTDVRVLVPTLAPSAQARVAEEVADVFAAHEQRFSRFLPDSELSRLNRCEGPCVVSAPLFEALVAARGYVDETDGTFDPAVGAALIAIGYDTSFAPGALDRDQTRPTPVPASLREVTLDAATHTVVRPAHVTIDLGGIAKGRAVDAAARVLPGVGAIDAGGDAMLRGGGPRGRGWLVDVEHPDDPAQVCLTLRVRDRAVATSAPNRRRWRAGTRTAHHLVDPRTGREACSDLAQVTVVAATTERADVLAKTAFLLGREAARAFLARRSDVAAVLVRTDGGVELVGPVDVVRARGVVDA